MIAYINLLLVQNYVNRHNTQNKINKKIHIAPQSPGLLGTHISGKKKRQWRAGHIAHTPLYYPIDIDISL